MASNRTPSILASQWLGIFDHQALKRLAVPWFTQVVAANDFGRGRGDPEMDGLELVSDALHG
jgi:hypothetical protein